MSDWFNWARGLIPGRRGSHSPSGLPRGERLEQLRACKLDGKLLNDDELAALCEVCVGGLEPVIAASKLGMSLGEFNGLFVSALDKLNGPTAVSGP